MSLSLSLSMARHGMARHAESTESTHMDMTTLHVVTMKSRCEGHGISCQGRQSFLGLPGPGRPHARQLRVIEQGVVGHSEMFASSDGRSCVNVARRDLRGWLAQGHFCAHSRATTKRISARKTPSPENSQGTLQDTHVRITRLLHRRAFTGEGVVVKFARPNATFAIPASCDVPRQPIDLNCPACQAWLPPAWTDRLLAAARKKLGVRIGFGVGGEPVCPTDDAVSTVQTSARVCCRLFLQTLPRPYQQA